jgi:hypothetical protein
MNIIEVSPKEYGQLVKSEFFYDSVQFNELNAHKTEKVKYLIFRDTKSRLGIIIGLKNGVVQAPFSAPFSCFGLIKREITISQYEETVKALDRYMSANYTTARFIFPPTFYAQNEISCAFNVMQRIGFTIEATELNYQIDLYRFDTNGYYDILRYNAKKAFLQAEKAGLTCETCKNEEEIIEAYEVIAANRSSKGYPLKMTCKDVCDTLKIVKHDVFIIKKGEKTIASAIIYRLNDRVAQVIYWGDVPGYSEYRPMNWLSYQVVTYYKQLGFRWLDIGPATEKGVPNYGLCDFKQSIGCETSLKFTLTQKYD